MVDSQSALTSGGVNPVAKSAGLLVVAALVALVLLRKLSVSVSV